MPQVNIAPNISTTQTANFQFTIVLTIPMASTLDRSSFSLANLDVREYDLDTDTPGDRIDVTAADAAIRFVLEEGEGNAFLISATLSNEISGAFQVGVTGSVRVDSASEMLSGAVKVINYDTLSSLGTTLGTPDYRDDGIIAIPVTFAYNVIAPSATIFQFARVSGDVLDGMQTWIVGEDTAYELLCQMPLDRKGRFSVGVNGKVFKEFSGNYDTVTATGINVDWDTGEPRIVNYDIPARYGTGVPLNIRIAYNVSVTGWNANNTLTEVFLLEGANLGTPLPYKWTGTSAPDFNEAVPADLTDTDWTLLATPPAGTPTPGSNGFDADGQWHGEEAQYYLIRFPDPQEIGIFNLTERYGGVRGPVR